MTNETPMCDRCGAPMAPGLAIWDGTPEHALVDPGPVVISGVVEPITTWKCPKCGRTPDP